MPTYYTGSRAAYQRAKAIEYAENAVWRETGKYYATLFNAQYLTEYDLHVNGWQDFQEATGMAFPTGNFGAELRQRNQQALLDTLVSLEYKSITRFDDWLERLEKMLHPRCYDDYQAIMDLMLEIKRNEEGHVYFVSLPIWEEYAPLYLEKFGIDIHAKREVA